MRHLPRFQLSIRSLWTWFLLLALAVFLSGCAALGAPWWYGWIWLAAFGALLSGCVPTVTSETPKSIFALPYAPTFDVSSLVWTNGGDGSKGYIIHDTLGVSLTGQSVAVGDLNGDGFADIAIGSPFMNFGYNRAGQVSVVYGHQQSYGPSLSIHAIGGEIGKFFLGEAAYGYLGHSVAIVRSVNNDSRPDLVAGVPASYSGYGSVAVIFGANTLPASGTLTTGPGRSFLLGLTMGARIGGAVTGGDINGDGIGDIAIGAPETTSGPYASAGAHYELAGTTGAWDDTYALNVGARVNRFYGGVYYGRFGNAIVGGGSLAGDGFDSLLISERDNYGYWNVRARFGNTLNGTAGYFNAEPFSFRLDAESDDDQTGYALAIADINGDGAADILAGARRANRVEPAYYSEDYQTGRVHVVFGTPDLIGGSLSPSALDGENGFTFVGTTAYGYFGTALAVGDINGDGLKDVLVAGYLPYNPSTYTPASPVVYVIFGKAGARPALCHVSEMSAGDGIILHTFGYTGGEGISVRSIAVGDVDGDDRDDIILGWPLANGSYGRVFVIFNKALQQ